MWQDNSSERVFLLYPLTLLSPHTSQGHKKNQDGSFSYQKLYSLETVPSAYMADHEVTSLE